MTTVAEQYWPAWWQKPDQIEWVGDAQASAHSHAGIVSWGARQAFLKFYGSGGEDHFVTALEVEELLAGVVQYRCGLQAAGVRVPANLGYAIVPGEDCFLLYMLEEVAGVSLHRYLASESEAFLARGLPPVLGMLDRLFDGAEEDLLHVGLDPKPSNFAVDTTGELLYVDVVWPLHRGALDQIHPDIKPVWRFRYFERAGVLLNVVLQFCRSNPAWRGAVISAIAAFLATQPQELTRAFLALPGIAPLSETAVALREGRLPNWNVDLLRAIGIQFVAEGRATDPDFLPTVMALTRTNPHEPLPHDRLHACRDLLLRTL